MPHHHGDDDYDDCLVAALNSLSCLSIVQNIYKKQKGAKQEAVEDEWRAGGGK